MNGTLCWNRVLYTDCSKRPRGADGLLKAVMIELLQLKCLQSAQAECYSVRDVRGWPSGRASAFQADLDGFDSRTPLQVTS
jgi:hypothetical protein